MKGLVLSFAYGFSKDIASRLSLLPSQLNYKGYRGSQGFQTNHCECPVVESCGEERMKWSRKEPILIALLLSTSLPVHGQNAELISKPFDPDFYEGVGNRRTDRACQFSAGGMRVVFSSNAFNLVPEDSNDREDVFLAEPVSDILRRASVNGSGQQANDLSTGAVISANGRYVVFESFATNLIHTDNSGQLYRFDTETGLLEIVSLTTDGSQITDVDAASISGDGNLVVFESEDQILLRNITLGETSPISNGSGGVDPDDALYQPRISADGGHVVFYSFASNLVPDDTNNRRDIFIHDLSQDDTTRIMGHDGEEPSADSADPVISSDGRWITFSSGASNLLEGGSSTTQDVYLYDSVSDTLQRISEDESGIGGNWNSGSPAISNDGRFIVFVSEADNLIPGLGERERRIFLYDRVRDDLSHVATDASEPSDPCVDHDGNTVSIAFITSDHPLIPSYVNDSQLILEQLGVEDPSRAGGGLATSRVVSGSQPPLPTSIATEQSFDLAISAGGQYVTFMSDAGNLIGTSPGSDEVLRLNLDTGLIDIASLDLSGLPSTSGRSPTISLNGRRVAFRSGASDLVIDDNNGRPDIFVHDFVLNQTRRASIATDGSESNQVSDQPVISADGSTVAFRSEADNLVADDSNGEEDIFVHHLMSGVTERVSISTLGVEADERSDQPDISANGRYVVFQSRGHLLDDGQPPTNTRQIWLRDLQLGETELISKTADGKMASGFSYDPKLSANGRWVMFTSDAVLDPAFPSLPGEVTYLHDRQSGTTQLVSLDTNEQPVAVDPLDGQPLSPDGNTVLFQSTTEFDDRRSGNPLNTDPPGTIYVRDLNQQRTRRITPQTVDGLPPDAELSVVAVDASGLDVYLVSAASNLVPGMFNGARDIYRVSLGLDSILRDRFEAPAPE